MIKIKLKDESILEVESGLTVLEIAKNISEGLARMATAAEIDGEVVDLRTVVEKDCNLNIVTFESSLNGKKAYWHTTSHIMAQAIKRLYPEIKLAIGPSIDNGFYYDFDTDVPFTPEMLEAIEKEMKKIIKEDLQIERFELPREEAIKLMEENNEPCEVGLINENQYKKLIEKEKNIENLLNELKEIHLKIPNKISAYDYVKRTEVSIDMVKDKLSKEYDILELEQAEITIKYEGYIKKAKKEAEKMRKMENKRIPKDIDYDKVPNLASEARVKLKEVKPENIGQALRISGVNPSDISILSVYMKRYFSE